MPTHKQLVDALADFYDEKRLSQYETSDLEIYGDASLRCGFEGEAGSRDGLWCSMTISEGSVRGTHIRLAKYIDSNATEPISVYERDNVPYKIALEWWLLMASGHIGELEEVVQ